MTDIDDLLGGAELDALLGDDDPTKNDSFHLDDALFGDTINLSDDDLLGGRTKPEEKSKKTTKITTKSSSSKEKSPAPLRARRGATTVHYNILSNIPLRLLPFVKKPDTFFVRYVQFVDTSQERRRCVVAVDKENVLVFESTNPETPIQSIPVGKIFGVISQTVVARKLLSIKYTEEYHTLIQVDGAKDLLMISSANVDNGEFDSPEHDSDIISVLKAVSTASGTIDLPMAAITGDELIGFCNFIDAARGDENMRRHHTELLAIRSNLTAEVANHEKERNFIIKQIQGIRGSSAGQVLVDMENGIENLNNEIADVNKKILDKMKRLKKATVSYNIAEGRLDEEKSRRSKAAHATMKSSEKEESLLQLGQYEIKKNAHMREMNKYSALQSVHERRLLSRGNKTAFSNMLELEERVETLEDENRFISGRIKQGKEQHSRQITALGKAKKIIADGKIALEKLNADVKQLQEMKAALKVGQHKKVPAEISREEPPSLDMPQAVGAADDTSEKPEKGEASGVPHSSDSSDLEVAPQKKPTISLSDDDEI